MSKYVIDAWAWAEYFKGSAHGAYVKEKVEKGDATTNVVTITEIMSKFNREGLDANEAFALITTLSHTFEVDQEFAKTVGFLHATVKKARHNFSLADAFALQTAKDLDAKVLTGDPDFKGIKEAEMLK